MAAQVARVLEHGDGRRGGALTEPVDLGLEG
jgi:hypothetical protein